MSLEPRYQHHSQKTLDTIADLDRLEQVAAAAGHGYARILVEHNAGWTEVAIAPENSRPNYDLRHIAAFSPDVIQALLFELSESRKKLAELGESIVIPAR
jgi:hypothetical protein